LLDGRMLCADCYKFIKSGKWCANIPWHETVFSERQPTPPSIVDKISGFLRDTDVNGDYEGKLARYEQQEQRFYSELEQRKREKDTERARYHEICDYWPKDQPPDWEYRTIGAKKGLGTSVKDVEILSTSMSTIKCLGQKEVTTNQRTLSYCVPSVTPVKAVLVTR